MLSFVRLCIAGLLALPILVAAYPLPFRKELASHPVEHRTISRPFDRATIQMRHSLPAWGEVVASAQLDALVADSVRDFIVKDRAIKRQTNEIPAQLPTKGTAAGGITPFKAKRSLTTGISKRQTNDIPEQNPTKGSIEGGIQPYLNGKRRLEVERSMISV